MSVFGRSERGISKGLFTYTDQSTLEIRSGGGCISIFGFPFLLSGLFIMQIPLGIIPVQGTSGPMQSTLLFLFGFVFAAVGAVLVFGRSGMILDRGRGSMIQWYGLLVPMKRSEYLLDSISQVEMTYESGDSDSAATWPVKLSGDGQVNTISIVRPTSFIEARQAAEELSRFLRKPLVDSSSGERIIRDADHLDESYRERVRRTGEAVSFLPPEPSQMRSRIERTGEGLIIQIPAPVKSGVNDIPIFISLVFAGLIAWFFLPPLLLLPMPELIRYIFLGFIGLFFIAGPVVSALRQMSHLKNQFERIIVTKDILRVQSLKQGKSTMMEIPITELEDLVAPTIRRGISTIKAPGMKKVVLGDIGSSRMPDGRPLPRFILSILKMVGAKGIIARSDKAIVEFAGGLDEAEVAWIFAVIRKTIAQ